jgi:hypothetical protein
LNSGRIICDTGTGKGIWPKKSSTEFSTNIPPDYPMHPTTVPPFIKIKYSSLFPEGFNKFSYFPLI